MADAGGSIFNDFFPRANMAALGLMDLLSDELHCLILSHFDSTRDIAAVARTSPSMRALLHWRSLPVKRSERTSERSHRRVRARHARQTPPRRPMPT